MAERLQSGAIVVNAGSNGWIPKIGPEPDEPPPIGRDWIFWLLVAATVLGLVALVVTVFGLIQGCNGSAFVDGVFN